ncbi:MAG: thiol-disulfide oxidoreductase [Planctomycetaceae bacterium]|nr:thiol-disulfide oxidoreductase [Planctomycetaceae bacterium]
MALASAKQSKQPVPPDTLGTWEVEVFHDGDCPICIREMNWMQKRDVHGRIRFTDIAEPSFDPAFYNLTQEDFIAEIQGRLPSGEWLKGVEVFRRLYSAIGFGAAVRLTRLPLIASGLDWGYKIFARNRLRLTGRCTSNCAATSAAPR